MKNYFSTLLLAAILCAPFTVSAQVTIGSDRAPSPWSLLDLDNSERARNNEQPKALHLPRLTDDDRDDLNLEATAGPESPARGLMIFNTDNECVEFWSGTAWISLCEGDEPPVPPVGGNIRASTCGLIPSNGIGGGLYTTFTIAYRDTFALAVEFFVDGVSRGRQRGNELRLSNPVPASQVAFRHLFSEDFLRPDMVFIEGGTFGFGAGTQAVTAGTFTTSTLPCNTAATSGSGSSVTLSSFYISRTPITQAQFEAVMGFNPSYFQCNRRGNIPQTGAVLFGNNFTGTAYAVSASARPVERVDWFMAVAFANRLSALEDRDIFYQVTVGGVVRNYASFWLDLTQNQVLLAPTTWTVALPANPQQNNGFRLLTDAEWEFAARGGVERNSATSGGVDYFFSNGNDAREVWHLNNPNQPVSGPPTHPVAQFRSNALGLYDMSGNVWEWVWDIYSGSNRVLRGGSWGNIAGLTRVSFRHNATPEHRSPFLGIRLASSAVE